MPLGPVKCTVSHLPVAGPDNATILRDLQGVIMYLAKLTASIHFVTGAYCIAYPYSPLSSNPSNLTFPILGQHLNTMSKSSCETGIRFYAQYTPLTRLNSTVPSRRRRRCVLGIRICPKHRVSVKNSAAVVREKSQHLSHESN